MKIHEYQARQLLREYGAPVSEDAVVTAAQEAGEAAARFGPCVVKAQIHSGGRGKAGGVRPAKSPREAREAAQALLGARLVTAQTGPAGRLVRRLLVTGAVKVEKEYYLSVVMDGARACPVIVASAEGGTEIEETAREHPERIAQIPVSPTEGFKRYEGLRAAHLLGLTGGSAEELVGLLEAMVRLFLEKDCSLVEINPLALTADGRLECLDAKITFDDNALFRHPEIARLRDPDEEDPKERRAAEYGLSYISLDGDIGCLVNGAGLAMATMDIIRHFGGSPANFLDVGGGATAEKVKAAFEILLSDGGVRAIFVNIFGGIMQCDVIAEGVAAAAAELGVSVPLVVRLEGTNAEKGKEILARSGLAVIPAADMADGARRAVEAAAQTERRAGSR